jgi:UDP-N-acetylglucosamine 3-dehydrogenase
MKSKRSLRVAVTGCGTIAQLQHLPSLHKIREATIVAVCDQNKDVVERTANKFGIARSFTDYSEMLDNVDIDMIDICTPPRTHLSLANQAIKKGYHVLVEKPIVLNTGELDEMVAAARKYNVKVCPVHHNLFEPATLKARTIIDSNEIGNVTGINFQVLHSKVNTNLAFGNKDHWYHSLPAGIFTETLPHPIYLATAFLGKLKLLGMYFGKSTNYDWVVADEVRLIVRGEKGMGTIEYSSTSPKSKNIMDIHGTRKHLHIDILNSTITEYGTGTPTRPSRALENIAQSYALLSSTVANTFRVISGTFYTGHYTLIQRFIKSIQDDVEPPVRLQEARDVIEMIEQITPLN